MRLRREDDRLNLTAELTVDMETGKRILTMTSQPKAGLGAEDFLGAVITCDVAGDPVYATLTSACAAQVSEEMKIISACGKLMLADKAYELTFAHTETASGTVTEEAVLAQTT